MWSYNFSPKSPSVANQQVKKAAKKRPLSEFMVIGLGILAIALGGTAYLLWGSVNSYRAELASAQEKLDEVLIKTQALQTRATEAEARVNNLLGQAEEREALTQDRLALEKALARQRAMEELQRKTNQLKEVKEKLSKQMMAYAELQRKTQQVKKMRKHQRRRPRPNGAGSVMVASQFLKGGSK
jgi:cysteinyl-tRNA synthetase